MGSPRRQLRARGDIEQLRNSKTVEVWKTVPAVGFEQVLQLMGARARASHNRSQSYPAPAGNHVSTRTGVQERPGCRRGRLGLSALPYGSGAVGSEP